MVTGASNPGTRRLKELVDEMCIRDRWHMAGYAVSLRESGEMNREGAFFFVERSAVKGEYPLPGAFKAYTKLI